MAKAEISRGWAIPYIYPTGLFIRDYLKEHKVAYVYEIWDALRRARLSAGVVDAEGRPRVCTYDNFMRNYIYTLKKIGLIELVKKGLQRGQELNFQDGIIASSLEGKSIRAGIIHKQR